MSLHPPSLRPAINPTKLLNIYNDYNNSITCVAHAPSQGRRCRNRINAQKRSIATSILHDLANPTRSRSVLYEQLLDLVDNTTCWIATHGDQAESIATAWHSILVQEIRKIRPVSSTLPSSPRPRTIPRTSAVVARIPDAAPGGISVPVPTQTLSVTRTRRVVQITAVEETTTISLNQHLSPSQRTAPSNSETSSDSGASRQSIVASPERSTTRLPAQTPLFTTPSTTRPSTSYHPLTTTTPNAATSTVQPVPNSGTALPLPPTDSTSAAAQAQSSIHGTSRQSNGGSEATEDNTCPICLQEFSEPYQTPCGHKFCRECIATWFGSESQKSCPMDRRSLLWTELVPVDDCTCSICLEDAVDPCETPCGHRFCRGCMEAWFRGRLSTTCPMDRRSLLWTDLTFEGDRDQRNMARV